MKISENQLSWKSDTFCRSENAPVIKNKSGIKYEARKMTTQFTKLQQFLSRGALGPIRNRKTVEKNHPERSMCGTSGTYRVNYINSIQDA